MSRIGKLPIPVPASVEVTLDGQRLTVSGPKGQLALTLHPHVQVQQADRELRVSVLDPAVKLDRSLWGLSRVLVANLITGVTQGFAKKLEVRGVGYRAELKGRELVLFLGFSQPVVFPLPEGIQATVDKNLITVSGIDKQLVGEVASQLRRLRPPEPYKGKGIRYQDEVVRRKAGKVVKAVGTK